MMRATHATEQLTIPDDVESPQAKLVYLYLEAVGETTLDDLADSLRLQKIAALSVLGSLRSEGLVDKDGSRYRTTA